MERVIGWKKEDTQRRSQSPVNIAISMKEKVRAVSLERKIATTGFRMKREKSQGAGVMIAVFLRVESA